MIANGGRGVGAGRCARLRPGRPRAGHRAPGRTRSQARGGGGCGGRRGHGREGRRARADQGARAWEPTRERGPTRRGSESATEVLLDAHAGAVEAGPMGRSAHTAAASTWARHRLGRGNQRALGAHTAVGHTPDGRIRARHPTRAREPIRLRGPTGRRDAPAAGSRHPLRTHTGAGTNASAGAGTGAKPTRARSRHGRGTQRERGRRDSSEGRGAGGAHTPAGTNATRPWGGRRGGSLRAVVQWR